MLIDSVNSDSDLKTNICIVGSGVGGGTLVKKLSEKNNDFIVVEAGGLKGESKNVEKEHVGRDFGVRTTTSIQLGGTSNLWHGILSPLDHIDFKKREWIPHSGWPISRDDLEPFYREAAEMLGVKDYDYFEEGTLSVELKKMLTDITFDREHLRNKLFMQPMSVMNFKSVVMDCVSNSPTRHCYYNLVALELISDSSGQKIKKLLVGSETGKTFFIEAEHFIISAGALETPRLLLNSRSHNSSGLGNGGDNVGRFLLDHPMGNVCQIGFINPQKAHIYSDKKYRSDTKIKTGLELNEQFQESLKLPNHAFTLRPSFKKGIDDRTEKVKLSLLAFKDRGVTAGDIWKVITNLNIVRQILVYKLSLNVTFKYADLFFLTEQIPNPNSTVSLSSTKDRFGYPIAQVNWQLLPEDIESVKAWFKLILTKWFPEDHYTLTHTIHDFNWDDILTTGIHHVGTARMADNEREGVVDKNLKVFGTENLYVCDGSIFCTSGNVNVSLSTAAFACRLVKYFENI